MTGQPPNASRPDADAIAVRIGQRVLLARREARFTRERLAGLADVSERYLTQLEKGEANVSIGVLGRVAAALGRDLQAFVCEPAATAVGQALVYGPLAALLAGMTLAEQTEVHQLIERHVEERRKRYAGIALLGLRGAGKSTLARLMAQRTGLQHVSTTERVEELAGVQVNELFNLGGSDAYRSLENEAIASLVADGRFIILETAGGVVANEEAFRTILANFRTIWLRASPDEHLGRVQAQGDMRPMRGNPRALENIKRLLAAREAGYARADHTIDTSGRSVEACLEALVKVCRPLLEARGVQVQ